MKKIITLAVMAMLLSSLAACGKAPVAKPDITETEPAELTLQDLDGWWYMDSDYPEGLHLFEIFLLDSAKETFSAYDLYKNELYTGGAALEPSGTLVLSVGAFGDVELKAESGELYDEDGVLAFTMGSELAAPDMSNLFGKWYLDGNASGEYYELTDGAFSRISENGDEYESDSYNISAETEIYSVGEPVEHTVITFGDETFAPEGTFSPELELFTVTDFGESRIYIKETAIGTAGGDTAAAQGALLADQWQTTDKSGFFSFYQNGSFEYRVRTETDEGISFDSAGSGTWVLNGDVLNLAWENGIEDACDFTGNTFYVSSLDAAVFNGKVAAGALEQWCGSYAGEPGEINVSVSIFDNSIDVFISLDDDIGSMYSTTLELEPDGGTASDEYIACHLDGGVLTLEPLNTNFDNYGGTFDKQ